MEKIIKAINGYGVRRTAREEREKEAGAKIHNVRKTINTQRRTNVHNAVEDDIERNRQFHDGGWGGGTSQGYKNNNCLRSNIVGHTVRATRRSRRESRSLVRQMIRSQ